MNVEVDRESLGSRCCREAIAWVASRMRFRGADIALLDSLVCADNID